MGRPKSGLDLVRLTVTVTRAAFEGLRAESLVTGLSISDLVRLRLGWSYGSGGMVETALQGSTYKEVADRIELDQAKMREMAPLVVPAPKPAPRKKATQPHHKTKAAPR